MEYHPRDCFARKIMKANRIIGGVYRKHLSPFGISNSQMSILFMLNMRRQLSQSQLAEMMAMEKSTVSRNLRRLLENGIIRKDNNLVSLTKRGKSLLKKITPKWNQAMEEIESIIGQQGSDAIELILNKLVK